MATYQSFYYVGSNICANCQVRVYSFWVISPDALCAEPICSFEYYTMFVAATGIPEENLEARLQVILLILVLHLIDRYLTTHLANQQRVIAATAKKPNPTQISHRFPAAVNMRHLFHEGLHCVNRVEACKEVNLMTSANLATVFAPNIIRPPEADDVMVMLEYTPVTNCLMQSLITHFDTLLAVRLLVSTVLCNIVMYLHISYSSLSNSIFQTRRHPHPQLPRWT